MYFLPTISIAGVSKKNSLGRKFDIGTDTYSKNYAYCRCQETVPILFLENVKNLKSHDKGIHGKN